MSTVVFLDIDGVLNRYNVDLCPIERPLVQQLNRITKATACKYVLSSAWRYMLLETEFGPPAMTLRGFEYLLRTHGSVGFELIGVTQSDEAFGWGCEHSVAVRGKQIRRWLAEHRAEFGVANYCVLDDMDLGISELGLNFVRTDGNVGLTAAKADEVIGVLQAGVS